MEAVNGLPIACSNLVVGSKRIPREDAFCGGAGLQATITIRHAANTVRSNPEL